MPGVGPLTAVGVEAFGPDMAQFKTGRDFAAWLGLVPRQHSSGGKERLGRMTKAGQADIRRVLIIVAMSRLNWLGQRSIVEGSWLSRVLARRPKMPGCDRAGQQDGPAAPGNADEERRLQGSGAGRRDMMLLSNR